MKVLKRILRVGLLLTIVMFVIYWAAFGFFVWRAPLPYVSLDFNRNGSVELFEVMYAAEYGTRPVIVNGKRCMEYFALKDGFTLKVVCPAPRMQ